MAGAQTKQDGGSRGLFSRSYQSGQDLEHMLALLVEGRAQTGDWRYWHTGELLFNFFMVTCHLDPYAHVRLWFDGEDTLAGYAILGEDPTFECQVLPAYAGAEIELEALSWVEQRLIELRRQDPQTWGGSLVTSVRQDDTDRLKLLEKHGFRRGEYTEVNFLRRLDEPIPASLLPAGCQVRAMVGAGDIPDRAAVQREVWTPYTVGNVSDEDYARFMRLPGYLHELDIVAVTPEGVIAAYVNGWVDVRNCIGDFGPVGARDAYRRQGLTRAVLLEGLRRMQARGMERVCVSTGVNNTPALRLYESIGFKPANKTFTYEKAA